MNLHRLAGLKYLEIKLRHYRSNNQWRTSNLCGYGTPLFQNSWFSPTPFGLRSTLRACAANPGFLVCFPMLSPSLRLGLSWERNVVWTACARPGLSYWRFSWRCDDVIFMEFHRFQAPDSAVFLSDSNLGVGENNPRAGKLMQRLGGTCWEGKSMGSQLLEITDIWLLIAINVTTVDTQILLSQSFGKFPNWWWQQSIGIGCT